MSTKVIIYGEGTLRETGKLANFNLKNGDQIVFNAIPHRILYVRNDKPRKEQILTIIEI